MSRTVQDVLRHTREASGHVTVVCVRALVVAAVLVTSLVTDVSRAGATAPVAVGWWTSASTTTPQEVVVPVGPDVPAGGLLVQSAADPASPVAFAAATWDVPADATVGKVVLKAVSSGTPVDGALGLCALDRPDFAPAAGAAMQHAPGYDCSHEIVVAPAADGSYSFNAEPLRTGPFLAVAIVPAASLVRVVLNPPAADSLTTLDLAQQPVQPSPTAAVGVTPAPVGAPLAALPALGVPAATGVQIAPTTAAEPPQTAVALPTLTNAARTSGGGFDHKGLLALGMFCALVVAWTAARTSAARPLPERQQP